MVLTQQFIGCRVISNPNHSFKPFDIVSLSKETPMKHKIGNIHLYLQLKRFQVLNCLI
jgi:hypothetical protein